MSAFKGGRQRVAVQLPTGTGKTVLFSALAAEQARTSRVLVLAHRAELLDQAHATLGRMVPASISVGIVQAERDDADAGIVVASVPTLIRPERLARVLAGGPVGLVVVDEAHHAAADSYRAVLDGLGCFTPDGPRVLGVSATMFRADGKGLGDVFEQIAFDVPLLDMIRAGYLANLRAKQIELAVDLDALRIVDGDYHAGELADALAAADAPAHVAAALAEHARGRVALCFTPTVALADATADACRGLGLRAAVVTGEQDADTRRAAFAAIRTGRLDVLVNCAIATEGTDLPRVDCVAIARPTRSRVLYTQMLGRGTRLHPAKVDCLVLDCVGATAAHDLVTVAGLFNTPPHLRQVLERDGLAAAVERDEADQARRADAVALRAREIDLFARRRAAIAWVALGRHWVVSIGDGATLALLVAPDTADDVGTVDVFLFQRGERWQVDVEQIAMKLPTLELAQGVAEDWLRGHPRTLALAAPGARWRQGPASDRQRELLARFVPARLAPGLTKGEAGNALTACFARRTLRAAGFLGGRD